MTKPASLKLRVKDFQRVEDALLEVLGIVFITGPNNQGKTSLLRAAHASAAGRLGDRHVRRGTKEATVGIDYPEDPDNQAAQVAWIKGGGGAKYYIDGEPFTTLGRRGVPLEDLEKIGIKEIKYGANSHYLMFSLKGEPNFLVDLPPTQVFDYVSKILQERQIIPVIKTMTTDAQALNSGLVALEGEITTRRQSLLTWGGDLGKLEAVVQYQGKVQGLQKELASLRRMRATREEIKKIQAEAQGYMTKVEGLDRLLDLASPKVQALETETKLLTEMKRQRIQLYHIEEEELMIRDKLGVLKTQAQSFPDLKAAEKLVQGLASERETLKKLQVMRSGVLDVQENIKKTESLITKAGEELRSAEEGFERIKKEIGVCPTCGSELGGCDGRDG